jgi:hypothetical protein
MASKKYTVILDIDETFLYFISEKYYAHSWNTLSDEEKAKYKQIPIRGGVFIVRPYLSEFLDFVFKHFNVGIWTWSDPEYAEGIPSQVLLEGKPDRKLVCVLSAEHAEAAGDDYGGSKAVSYLWSEVGIPNASPATTILIDDLPSNSLNKVNMRNSITIKPFALFGEDKQRRDPYEDVSQDTSLLEVIEILKRVIALDKMPIFSDEKIQLAGLQDFVRKIQYTNKKGETINTTAIGAGKSHFFVGGKRRRAATRKNRRRSAGTRKRRAGTRRSK